ncbi:hypothetical protein FIBSPDRAFT_905249 [Athelia psychrophila]|uniref:Uncharacterized protein n=1 Tax=Athelia psychrophila TaxID=1759441 RepID=A0A167TNX1_9AGAM|nr:hypothetical protein FIBSPDRAFT_905249 [Fibularhizoctonia sp. CBS 109695]
MLILPPLRRKYTLRTEAPLLCDRIRDADTQLWIPVPTSNERATILRGSPHLTYHKRPPRALDNVKFEVQANAKLESMISLNGWFRRSKEYLEGRRTETWLGLACPLASCNHGNKGNKLFIVEGWVKEGRGFSLSKRLYTVRRRKLSARSWAVVDKPAQDFPYATQPRDGTDASINLIKRNTRCRVPILIPILSSTRRDRILMRIAAAALRARVAKHPRNGDAATPSVVYLESVDKAVFPSDSEPVLITCFPNDPYFQTVKPYPASKAAGLFRASGFDFPPPQLQLFWRNHEEWETSIEGVALQG